MPNAEFSRSLEPNLRVWRDPFPFAEPQTSPSVYWEREAKEMSELRRWLISLGRSREWAGTREGRHRRGQAPERAGTGQQPSVSASCKEENTTNTGLASIPLCGQWSGSLQNMPQRGTWIGWSYMGSCSFLHWEKNRWLRGFPLAPPPWLPSNSYPASMLILSSTQNAQPSSISGNSIYPSKSNLIPWMSKVSTGRRIQFLKVHSLGVLSAFTQHHTPNTMVVAISL